MTCDACSVFACMMFANFLIEMRAVTVSTGSCESSRAEPRAEGEMDGPTCDAGETMAPGAAIAEACAPSAMAFAMSVCASSGAGDGPEVRVIGVAFVVCSFRSSNVDLISTWRQQGRGVRRRTT